MLTQKNVNIPQEIYNMKRNYDFRFHQKFSIVGNEARIVKHHPTGTKNFEVHEWSVKINIKYTDTDYTEIGPFNLSDLNRLSRVIRRSIKILQNKNKHNTKTTWPK